jgi:peptidyl-prolyl cis-trans isomerase C
MRAIRTALAVVAIFGLGTAWLGGGDQGTAFAADAKTSGKPLVRVNSRVIGEADLQRMFQSRRVPQQHQDALRQPFLEEMVDAALLREFLATKKVKANAKDVTAQVEQIRKIAAQEGDADKVLAARGYSIQSLKEEMELPLAWQAFIEQTWQGDQLTAFYARRHAEFDGTRVSARQIFLRVKEPEGSPERTAALEQLRAIREQIAREELTFEEAAKTYSQASTKDRGGDLGEFTYSGRMPEAFSAVAFTLKPGQMSQPFSTRAGCHLCLLVKRTPGDLALEDVRKEVLSRIAQEQWREIAKAQRETAKIEWLE